MKRNATSHTMGPILPSTPTQHQHSMRKITHTSIHARTHARAQAHTHTHTHAYTAVSDESNRSLAYKKAYTCFFYKAFTCS